MRVRDFCQINSTNIKKSNYSKKYLYLETGGITKNKISEIRRFDSYKELPSRAKRVVFHNDIIISTVRPVQEHYGIIQNPPKNLLVSTGFTVLTPNVYIVNPYYLYYYLTKEKLTNYFQMLAESSVSSYPSITSDIIGNVKISLPLIDEQNEIVNKILPFDKLIELNYELIDAIEETMVLLYKKWFV